MSPARNPDLSQVGAWASTSKGGPPSTLTFGSSTSASSFGSGGKSTKGSSSMLDEYIKSPASSQPWSPLKIGR
ncbi:uncharacterized protein N7498_007255 [Penicillium cinerascens]|uniref:Uncharacterized protein n=1 Tax=Penicillium cinerascens TaxID=70096 RepID=A0A9W9JJR0_9EURO|nr:uncharacterized protein N7498_007255 [Penicillium cinerascens]KAJ5198138.1 hypothetical protein N7498_007255 [Penicillium cinerascens]